jgi:hypothetical protein
MSVRVTINALDNFRRILIRFSASMRRESKRTKHLLNQVQESLERTHQELKHHIDLCEEKVENARNDEENGDNYYRALRALEEAKHRLTEFNRLCSEYRSSAGNCMKQFNRQETMSGEREKVKANIDRKIEVLSQYLGSKSIATRFNWTPTSKGIWSGTRGRSVWQPDTPEIQGLFFNYNLDGIRYINGFPDFSPVTLYEATLLPSIYLERPKEHEAECNSQLAVALDDYPALVNYFTDEQIEEIRRGNTPDDYTWHHHQETGRMQLVPQRIHAACRHVGGMSIWGSGY